MKKTFSAVAGLLALCLLLSGCSFITKLVPTVTLPYDATFPPVFPSVTVPADTVAPTLLPTTEPATEPPSPSTAVPPTTLPEHSELYIPGLDVEQVILFFNEVCLDSEFTYGGDATVVQKWEDPIYYQLSGAATAEDLAILESFIAWLNALEGFPGMYPSEDPLQVNMPIRFCTREEIYAALGDGFAFVDGATKFWYLQNVLYEAEIYYATDAHQHVRNGVILEEIYNCLGAAQDTVLREDSIIYSYYSEPQELTQEDILILKLLYHPEIKPGMNAQQCEEVIRRLYY